MKWKSIGFCLKVMIERTYHAMPLPLMPMLSHYLLLIFCKFFLPNLSFYFIYFFYVCNLHRLYISIGSTNTHFINFVFKLWNFHLRRTKKKKELYYTYIFFTLRLMAIYYYLFILLVFKTVNLILGLISNYHFSSLKMWISSSQFTIFTKDLFIVFSRIWSKNVC